MIDGDLLRFGGSDDVEPLGQETGVSGVDDDDEIGVDRRELFRDGEREFLGYFLRGHPEALRAGDGDLDPPGYTAEQVVDPVGGSVGVDVGVPMAENEGPSELMGLEKRELA